jgi:hypothetical protein
LENLNDERGFMSNLERYQSALEDFKRILEKGVSVGSEEKQAAANKFLLLAANERRHDGVVLALENGADVNCQDPDFYHYTPLMYACNNADAKIMDTLIAKDADVNKLTIDGQTALMIAAHGWSRNSHATQDAAPVIDALVNAGANVHQQAFNGTDALSMSAMNNLSISLSVVNALIKHGANVNRWIECKDQGEVFFKTPLTNFINQFDHNNVGSSLEAIKLLVDAGAEVNPIASKDQIAEASGYAVSDSVGRPNEIYSQVPGSPSGKYTMRTPLAAAIQGTRPELVQYLIDNGAEPTQEMVNSLKDIIATYNKYNFNQIDEKEAILDSVVKL